MLALNKLEIVRLKVKLIVFFFYCLIILDI